MAPRSIDYGAVHNWRHQFFLTFWNSKLESSFPTFTPRYASYQFCPNFWSLSLKKWWRHLWMPYTKVCFALILRKLSIISLTINNTKVWLTPLHIFHFKKNLKLYNKFLWLQTIPCNDDFRQAAVFLNYDGVTMTLHFSVIQTPNFPSNKAQGVYFITLL